MEEDVVCMYENLFTSPQAQNDDVEQPLIPDEFALLAENLDTALKGKVNPSFR